MRTSSVSVRRASLTLAIAAVAAMAFLPSAIAADGDDEGWKDTAELSYVSTSGNSDSDTFGFKNKLWRKWTKSSVEFNMGGIRSESTILLDSYAIGTAGNFDDDLIEEDQKTAEAYFFNGRYDREISKRFFWFAGAGWDRNEFAGIQDRYTGFGGIGNIWVDEERVKFRTDYAVTYNDQEDVFENPDFDGSFLGFRFSWNYFHKFGEVTTYGNDLVMNANLDESEDWRGDMLNWVSVAMSENLALKVSHRLLYDNLPSLQELDLFPSQADATAGTNQNGTVLVELDEIDTIFTASLVINF